MEATARATDAHVQCRLRIDTSKGGVSPSTRWIPRALQQVLPGWWELVSVLSLAVAGAKPRQYLPTDPNLVKWRMLRRSKPHDVGTALPGAEKMNWDVLESADVSR